MRIEDQVCSLELAQKLKELGVKQESAFFWCKGFSRWVLWQEPESKVYTEKFSAFTVAELGEMLPFRITSKEINYRFRCHNFKADTKEWVTGYHSERGSFSHWLIYFDDEKESDARAELIIWTKGNNFQIENQT